jgi:glycosyltransferase involved in cell wall biosynthesis
MPIEETGGFRDRWADVARAASRHPPMTERDPRISIIITSYNHRAYLVEAIESVLGQTLMPYEIIVADDASSDGSQDTIRAYERRFPGLVRGVFQAQNCGIPRNRNAALLEVTGDYVGVLDGDDWFLPHKLERQVALLRENPEATLVYGNFRVVDSQRRPIRVKWSVPQPSGNVFWDVAKGKTGLLRTLIADYQAVKAAGFMDERFQRFDGLWLTIKLAATCRVTYVDEILLDKRNHPTSDSKTLPLEDRRRDLLGIYRDLLPLLGLHASDQERGEIVSAWRRTLGDRADSIAAEM